MLETGQSTGLQTRVTLMLLQAGGVQGNAKVDGWQGSQEGQSAIGLPRPVDAGLHPSERGEERHGVSASALVVCLQDKLPYTLKRLMWFAAVADAGNPGGGLPDRHLAPRHRWHPALHLELQACRMFLNPDDCSFRSVLNRLPELPDLHVLLLHQCTWCQSQQHLLRVSACAAGQRTELSP
jgi:hypothetical protein